LKFEGTNEYVEDLVTRIDTPRLENLDITFFNETVFDISHLSQFISWRVPKFQEPPDEAHVAFSDDHITATLSFPAPGYERLVLGILRGESAGLELVSSLVQFCRSFLPAFAMAKRLYIYQNGGTWQQRWKHGVQDSHWLQLLHFFTDAKDLYVSRDITRHILPVLKELVGESTTEVLPSLQNLFLFKHAVLCGPTDIEAFIAARRLSGHPITIFRWDGCFS
jgi:hypothetical protein